LVSIAVVESVYSAVRTDSLYKADYVWSLERLILLVISLQNNICIYIYIYVKLVVVLYIYIHIYIYVCI